MKAQVKEFKLNKEIKTTIYMSATIEEIRCNLSFETETSEYNVWLKREDLEQLALKIKEALAGK